MHSIINRISIDKLYSLRATSIACLGGVFGSATVISGVIDRQEVRMEGALIKEGGCAVLVEGLDGFPF